MNNQLLLLQALLNSCVSGIMTLKPVKDASGKIIDFTWTLLNNQSLTIIQRKEYDLIGKNLLEELPEFKNEGLFNKFINVEQTGISMNCEYCWLRLGKEKIWLNIEAIKLDDGLVVTFQDHTNVKNTEIKLKKTEEIYKKIESITHIGIWEANFLKNKITWSDELFRICGLAPQSFQPNDLFNLSNVLSSDRLSAAASIFQLINERKIYKEEKEIFLPNGEKKWVVFEGELIKNKEDNCVKSIGYVMDITERKLSEMRLANSERIFRSLFQGANVGIFLVGKNETPINVNPKLCEMLGYTEDELCKMPSKEFTYPDDWKKDEILHKKVLQGEINRYEIEKRYVKKNGSYLWVLIAVSAVSDYKNEFEFGIVMVRDIHKRKQAEKKQEESERKLKAIFNSSYQFTGLLDLNGNLIEANETALNFGGLNLDEVIDKPFWETKWWQTSDSTKNKLKESIDLASKGNFIRYEADVLGKENKVITIDFTLKPVKDNSGKVVLIIPEGRDISEKKEVEKLLREREQQLKLFISQAPTAIAMLDKNLIYIAASERWIEDYKIKDKDVIGKSHYEVFPEISEEWKNIHKECLNGKIRQRLRDPFRRADGSIQWIRWDVRPWYDINNEIGGLLMFTEDITEDVESEESILKLNKELDELNQQKIKLFSIIAHDMKGPINNCMGLIDLITINRNTLSREELLEYFAYMQKAVTDVNDLIEELLLWARSQFNTLSFSPSNVNLSSCINKLMKTLKPLADKKAITIEAFVDKDTYLWADENMLNVILRNLISNAIKFTIPKGKIIIKSDIKDGFVETSVIDNGVGIKKENLDKLFNIKSNFTTFGTAGEKGTGLGLDLSYNFVEKQGGKFFVDSAPGKGSTFKVILPEGTENE